MHVGASLRLLLLILLLGDSPVAPGTGIQGDPLLPPCETGVSHGRALGDPMHPGGENPGGASLGGLLVRASPRKRSPGKLGKHSRGGLLVRAIPSQEKPGGA